MFFLLTVGVVFSFSRAAWINLALGIMMMIAVYALRRGGVRQALRLLTSVAVAVAVVAVALAATGSLTFLQSRAHTQAYDTKRFGAQREGLRLVAEHPFGVGPGQFELYAPLSAHSTYVRALAELGVLGFVTVASLLIATLIFATRNAALGRETYGIGSAPLLGAWAGLLLSGFVIDTLHWRHLWLVAALIWAGAVRRPQSRRDRLELGRRGGRVVRRARPATTDDDVAERRHVEAVEDVAQFDDVVDPQAVEARDEEHVVDARGERLCIGEADRAASRRAGRTGSRSSAAARRTRARRPTSAGARGRAASCRSPARAGSPSSRPARAAARGPPTSCARATLAIVAERRERTSAKPGDCSMPKRACSCGCRMSPEIKSVLRPARASALPRLTVTVVLPSSSRPLVMRMMCCFVGGSWKRIVACSVWYASCSGPESTAAAGRSAAARTGWSRRSASR